MVENVPNSLYFVECNATGYGGMQLEFCKNRVRFVFKEMIPSMLSRLSYDILMLLKSLEGG